MKTLFRYKDGYSIRLSAKGYLVYKGRTCEAWRIGTFREAQSMHKYLIS